MFRTCETEPSLMDRTRHIKANGVHYTPAALATYLARRTVAHLESAAKPTILDPACGDGILLKSIHTALPTRAREGATLVGFDQDSTALSSAAGRLEDATGAIIDLRLGDFLAAYQERSTHQRGLWSVGSNPALAADEHFDAIIANPPYVRTQNLNQQVARDLARNHGLTGRVDLFHVFVAAMTDLLHEGGVIGLLCSNRFLSTQAGAAIRSLLRTRYELLELVDLGDTKLFSAAVLPAIVIARKRAGVAQQRCIFSRIYEMRKPVTTANVMDAPTVLDALSGRADGLVRVGGTTYRVEQGVLAPGGKLSDPWMLSFVTRDNWLAIVQQHTRCTFGDVASVRVGIKTNAGRVFIRNDWDTLPDDIRPDNALLRPLLTHDVACRWRATTGDASLRVLYPHVRNGNGQRAVDLQQYPRAGAYLRGHYDQLAGRSYLMKSKSRQWFEIWVPQDPEGWAAPKIVWPDISERAPFYLDDSGAVVDGDSYWISLGGTLDHETAYVMLAVANSRFILQYYDAVMANQLYAGRRRFMAQNVNRFPLPRLGSQQTRQFVDAVAYLVMHPGLAVDERVRREEALEAMVWAAFGLVEEVAR